MLRSVRALLALLALLKRHACASIGGKQLQVLSSVLRALLASRGACFTGTEVRILTPEVQAKRRLSVL